MRNLFFTAALLLTLGGLSRAQAPGTTGPTPTPQATPVPLDGGASLLLASGLAYGLRRLRQHRQARRG